jgi:hypothetical protein
VIALAHQQAAAQRAQQARYKAIVARFADRPEEASRARAAELGIRLARSAAELWEEILERETQVHAA